MNRCLIVFLAGNWWIKKKCVYGSELRRTRMSYSYIVQGASRFSFTFGGAVCRESNHHIHSINKEKNLNISTMFLFLLIFLLIALAIFLRVCWKNDACCVIQGESEAEHPQPRPAAPRAPVQRATAWAPAAPVPTGVATSPIEPAEIPAFRRSSMGRILKPVGSVSVTRLESPSTFDIEADTGGEDSTPEQEMTQQYVLTADFGDNEVFAVEELSCTICLVDFTHGESIQRNGCFDPAGASCDHIFHPECISSWMQKCGRNECPCCRRTFHGPICVEAISI